MLRLKSRRVFRPNVCPHCGKELVPGVAGPNLIVVTLRPCSHCSRWVNIRKAHLSSEIEGRGNLGDTSEEEILRRRIEESKHE